jgi:hypothetical protein
MSDTNKAEPVPWELGGCSGRMITTASGYCGDGFIADVDTLANAAFIVKAVNNHEKLLTALKNVLDVHSSQDISWVEIREAIKAAEQ